MKGINIAEQAHVVNILAPIDITGGKTAQAFSMKDYAHASIIIPIGVSAAAFNKILVNQCTDVNGTGATAIPFALYTQETAGASHDTLSTRTQVASSGYTPNAADNIFYIIEIDASELTDGYDCIQLQLTNATNSVIASALAILSGARYGGKQSATVN